MTPPVASSVKVFIGPGLSPFKRFVTIFGVVCIIALVLWIGVYQGFFQGGSAVGSTIVAVLFILGFIYYLRLMSPIPFTIQLTEAALVKRSKNGDAIEVRWADLTQVKEEFFPNGKRISITVFRKPATPQEKPKAWAVYRDDVTDLDGLAEALRAVLPETCAWVSEHVHE